MNIPKIPKDPSMGTPLKRTHEISSFFPQHENEAVNWKLLFMAFYITTSRRFKCVIRKWATPLDILASGLGFIPWGIHFGSRQTSVE